MKNSFPAKVFVLLFLFSTIITAQQLQKADWRAYKFLIGEWVGEGNGTPGEAVGSSVFSFDLQNQILVRKSFADYPAANNRPAFRHDDLMIIYQENKLVKANYYDNEGHIINYAVKFSNDSSSVIFESDPKSKTARFRFTYTKVETNRMKFSFEFAPPGKSKSFTKYLDGFVRKKN